MGAISKVKIRMYKVGTGDCFALKFYAGNSVKYNMMIDGGTWSGSSEHLEKYVKDIKAFFKDKLDLLVITHEHKDHVHLFDACEELFTDDSFEVDKIWMAWTEDDSSKMVAKWKTDFGQKKSAFALATQKISKLVNDPDYAKQFKKNPYGSEMLAARKTYSKVLDDFAELHFSLKGGKYVNGLKGMEVVKNDIKRQSIEFLSPGDIKENNAKIPGVKFYVLGPPDEIKAVKKEKGRKGSGQTYEHNKDLEKSDAFAAALNSKNPSINEAPFRKMFIGNSKAYPEYNQKNLAWRTIDNDWLLSSGQLALRMNSATNNLSLAMAIEIGGDSGKVLLFPGDAEFGSWNSWHDIPWAKTLENEKHFTEDLLNRTVFYKVAHHLSQNGTARKLGMDMMTNDDLTVMATLDYDCISSRWTGTMPNRLLLRDIIEKSKGKFIVMNDKDLFYDLKNTIPLKDRILEERKRMTKGEQEAFKKSYLDNELFHELTIKF